MPTMPAKDPAPAQRYPSVHFRLPEETRQRIDEAAYAAGLTRSKWILAACEAALSRYKSLN
jgi:uncharacterized protein (DUF1778 family)